ncbi:MAG: ABC transporter ATP-binding protein [Desulfobacteraceae bacterium]|nr:ABC transporter ATP-binding protein [Desulfobacteraceae bacterium]
MSIVEVKGVDKTYQQGKVSVHALKGIELAVDRGSFAALAGPSGSGKTTLLNIIGGLDTPDRGEVRVDGNAYHDMTRSEMAELRLHRLGFVFQAYNLLPVLSAVENVEYVMQLQGVGKKKRREQALAILDEVGLSGRYHNRPTELSGGQQQRVAVARAIVSDPALVLADEPTANLDSKTGEGLLQIMRKMNREKGVTFVFSTHDKMVMSYADRLIHIRDGEIADGAPDK